VTHFLFHFTSSSLVCSPSAPLHKLNIKAVDCPVDAVRDVAKKVFESQKWQVRNDYKYNVGDSFFFVQVIITGFIIIIFLTCNDLLVNFIYFLLCFNYHMCTASVTRNIIA
jgi:hypothetical protein